MAHHPGVWSFQVWFPSSSCTHLKQSTSPVCHLLISWLIRMLVANLQFSPEHQINCGSEILSDLKVCFLLLACWSLTYLLLHAESPGINLCESNCVRGSSGWDSAPVVEILDFTIRLPSPKDFVNWDCGFSLPEDFLNIYLFMCTINKLNLSPACPLIMTINIPVVI